MLQRSSEQGRTHLSTITNDEEKHNKHDGTTEPDFLVLKLFQPAPDSSRYWTDRGFPGRLSDSGSCEGSVKTKTQTVTVARVLPSLAFDTRCGGEDDCIPGGRPLGGSFPTDRGV